MEDLELYHSLTLLLLGGVVSGDLIVEESRLYVYIDTHTGNDKSVYVQRTNNREALEVKRKKFTSGPTMALGSVMVATISLATSDTSRPAVTYIVMKLTRTHVYIYTAYIEHVSCTKLHVHCTCMYM